MFIIRLHPGVYTLNNRFASERGFPIAAIKIKITSAVRLKTEHTNQTMTKLTSNYPQLFWKIHDKERHAVQDAHH